MTDTIVQPAPAVPDTDQTAAFLEKMFPAQLRHLVAISPDRGAPEARTFQPNQVEEMRAWIDARQGQKNLYYHVNELRDGLQNAKAKKEDVALARRAHVDVDVIDGSTLDKIKALVPAPTFIMMSGGGYQIDWEFKKPTNDIEQVERINRTIAAKLGGDNCHNADRIMRLPGTINMPNAKKQAAGRVPVTAHMVEEHWERRYDLSDFPQLDMDDELLRPPATAARVTKATHIVPVQISELPAELSPETLALIEHGDDVERPIGSKEARYKSRSEVVFRVACDLAKAGCSEETIAGTLINVSHGISISVREKKRPKTSALRQARSAIATVTNGWPDPDKNGQPRPTMRNTYIALQRMNLAFSYDVFQHRKYVNGAALGEVEGQVSDDGCAILRGMIIDSFQFDPRAENVRDAVYQLCLENRIHPIRQMLAGLVWDGVPRIDRWLTNYLGADDNPLNEAIGWIMLIAAVRRVREPGVKFDEIIVLEGRQGTGKSTALQILAGEGFHSDNDLLLLQTKEQMEAIEGVWIYEIGEISGLRKAEVEKVKAFASRRVDRARMSYGRFSESRARQAIFVGTTNEEKYLRDMTGNRRFWPVKTGQIDLNALRRDRDQLWAEAAKREAEGESIRLPEELWALAAVEQDSRMEDDPWLDRLATVNGKAFGDEVRVLTIELLDGTLGIPYERQHSANSKRLKGLMEKLGWKADKFKVQGRTVRGFKRPKLADHVDDPLPEKDTAAF